MSDRDYTRIPIEFDPQVQRMRGVTRHGGLAFDVPFLSPIEGNLYVGGCQDGLVLPGFVVHLVSLYPWESYTVRHELASRTEVRAYDDDVEHLEAQLSGLAAWVSACLETGPTLVHCQAGLNRSSLVAACVLMLRGRSARQAIDLLRLRRSPAVLCNRSFETWLLNRDLSRG
jgi:protein-tyrosine phosphatase